ncbi:MAG: glycoside hydrolase family 9 protein [Clostridiales bacterium]|nr:glycoside hydrolase family 9 protein [Clostridiales bacterium]
METLKREITESAFIHKPLPLHREMSLEAETAKEKILMRKTLDRCVWTAEGMSDLWEAHENGTRSMHFETVSPVGERPFGELENGDCSNLGQAAIRVSIEAEDWRGYNRLYFRVRPACEGIRRPHLGLQFYNEGEQPVPDKYGREGFHTVNLENGKWNECCVEIPSLSRDRVTGIAFTFSLSGTETPAEIGNCLKFDIDGLELQLAARTQKDSGWTLGQGEIAWCFSGYAAELEKRAVIGSDAPCAFVLADENGEQVFSGKTCPTGYAGLTLADFTAFSKPGRYTLRTGNGQTDEFVIGKDIWLPSAWKALNFLFCERCGYPVPGSHLSCHRDVLAHHDGKAFVFNGGWHDAGDLSQQLIQSAEVTYSLFEMYMCLKNRGEDGAFRFLEEALWGLDYLLKSRFGDGYRATSVGMSMWTQGFAGDRDDVSARVHNNAYENYLCAGIEAFAAKCISDEDPDLAARALKCAESDFRFAEEKFALTGFSERPPCFWEHSYMTPESVFSATMAWSAALLYGHTRKGEYESRAVSYARTTLECMEAGCACQAFENGGFFWRDRQKQIPVHFNHQARDQIFAQMLRALFTELKGNEDEKLWREAAQRHAGYLKKLYSFASPYGMMPAGIYRMDETDDRESFFRQHLLVGDEALSEYPSQLKNGVEIGGGWYLRQFPVWFSFRGNNAVLLSQAKAAAILGDLTGDASFKDIASAQLEWNIGLNPFRQSLMYGEGRRYASQYAVLPGEMTGELPVGVQTRGTLDEPYWPQMNDATYKEVWTTPAARWLSVVAELMA